MLREKELPKVSVGLLAYNRAVTLRQAIDSVLNQNYANIELIISDDASTDKTREICEEFSCKDERVKYIRNEYNHGPTANFIEVLNNASGEFFMWLSDDDWLDSSYISECVKTLLKDNGLSSVAGKTMYYRQDNSFYEGRKINHLQNSGLIRIVDFYFKVRDNGSLYGVMKKEDLNNILFLNVMCNDGLVMATIAFLGKIKVIDSTSIHRRLGGTSANWRKIAAALSLPKFEALFPVLTFAINAFEDISWRVPVFSRLGRVRRHIIACYVFFIIIFMKSAPLLLIGSFENMLEICFGERRARSIRSFLKKVVKGKA